MRATEVLADPLADLTARLLTGLAQELYALLWRAGLLEAEQAAPPRPARAVRPLRAAG